jgi:hypothetical protein
MCRVCRNRRAHERYYSNPEIRSAEIARWLKSNRLRKLRRRAEAMAAEDSEPVGRDLALGLGERAASEVVRDTWMRVCCW